MMIDFFYLCVSHKLASTLYVIVTKFVKKFKTIFEKISRLAIL